MASLLAPPEEGGGKSQLSEMGPIGEWADEWIISEALG